MKKIIVTGAAGYIGGQISLQLRDAGFQVIGIDLCPAPVGIATSFTRFHITDFADETALQTIVEHRPDAIIHCAGTSLVGPSMNNPQLYYQNNVVKTLRLLDTIIAKLPETRIIFSSSAAVYGNPIKVPCKETDLTVPISPYGQSKLMIEQAMASYRAAYGLDYIAFRFFNACGADPSRRHGQAPGATHIVARVLESVNNNTAFDLYGDQYLTRDGTCVRDYVHVSDIANAHILAIDQKVYAGVYNLGGCPSGLGTSNREIIGIAENVTSRSVTVTVKPARPGDPSELTADSTKFTTMVGTWNNYDLKNMIQHAWNWYVRQDTKV